MLDVERMEELGRKLMAASVEAQYLGLPGVVGYLDGAFADVVRLLADEHERVVKAEQLQRAVEAEEVASAR